MLTCPARSRCSIERCSWNPHFAEARAYHALCQFNTVDGGYSNDAGLLYKTEVETRQALDDNPRSAVARSTRAAVSFTRAGKSWFPER